MTWIERTANLRCGRNTAETGHEARGQGVDAGSGHVVHRARLGLRDPQREPVRAEHRPSSENQRSLKVRTWLATASVLACTS